MVRKLTRIPNPVKVLDDIDRAFWQALGLEGDEMTEQDSMDAEYKKWKYENDMDAKYERLKERINNEAVKLEGPLFKDPNRLDRPIVIWLNHDTPFEKSQVEIFGHELPPVEVKVTVNSAGGFVHLVYPLSKVRIENSDRI
jgi:hypothetical protein